MMRVSHNELVERWSQTYRDDGYDVRADGVEGLSSAPDVNGTRPDIEASNDGHCIYIQIIDSPEDFVDSSVRQTTQRLAEARGSAHALHLVVAAECMLELTTKLAEWNVEPDLVHVT